MTIETLVQSFDIPVAGLRRRYPAAGERIVAIGDIHGRLDLLRALIPAIEDHVEMLPERPGRVIILGDFIDRGPASRQVVSLLRVVSRRYGEAVTVLQGNHEASLLAAARGDADAQAQWLRYGGLETLESYGIDPRGEDESAHGFGARLADAIGLDVLDWIDQLPLAAHHAPFFFCHAGIRPGRALARQIEDDLLWIRDDFIASRRDHGAIIVHGHTISDEVEVRHNRIGVDTGAYASGMLSAVLLDPDGNWTISVRDRN